MTVKLILVRHGLTDWNRQLRYQGWAPVPLSADGRTQARLVAQRLHREPIARVYSSDLARAMETAREVADACALAVTAFAGLRELDFGCWEGMTYAEIRGREPELVQAWAADCVHTAAPEGESLAQMSERVIDALAEIEAQVGDATAVAITHGGPIQALLCERLGLPLARHWQFQVNPGSITILEFHPAGAILCRLNDTSHLDSDEES